MVKKFALIVGSIKCGTTSLFQYLSEHPQIAPCQEKEPKFFNRRYDRGADYYNSLWDWETIGKKIALEATPSYTRFTTRNPENSAEKIAEFQAQESADFKFIYLVRDPIERIESHYNHSRIYPKTKIIPFAEGVDTELIEVSKYASQIEEYYKRFPHKSILLLNFEDLKQNPQKILEKVCDFLEIDSTYQFKKVDVVYNSREQRRKISFPGASLVESIGLRHLLSKGLSEDKKQVFRKAFGSARSQEKLSKSRRQDVLEILKEDLLRLRSTYGVDISKWKNTKNIEKTEYTKTMEEHIDPDGSSISLCICTMNRPDDLTKCIESVLQCAAQPSEIIVSDDSPDPTPTKAVVAQYPSVTYQPGPRRGLGPNRNACIRTAKGTHLMFIDDDVCVPPDFLSTAHELITKTPNAVITGHEIKHRSWEGTAQKVLPKNADFWGIMRVPIEPGNCCSVVMNSAIFPASLFRKALFDECLRYGYEELDIARHAVALGYKIVHQDALWVDHYQSLVDRESNWKLKFASQMYTTVKAYLYYEKALPKATVYALLAPLKITGSLIKRRDPKALSKGFASTISAYQHFFSKKEKGLIARIP